MVLLYQHSRGAAVATEGGDVHRRRRRRRHIRVRRSVHCDVVGDHGVRGRDDGSRRRGDLVAVGRRAGGLLPSAAAAAPDGEEVVEGDVLDDDVLGGAALVSPVLPLVGVLAAGGPLRELNWHPDGSIVLNQALLLLFRLLMLVEEEVLVRRR